MENIILLDTQSFQAIENGQKTQVRLPITSKKIKNDTHLSYSLPDSGAFEFTTSYHSEFWLKAPHKRNDFVTIKEKRTQNTIRIQILKVDVQRLKDIKHDEFDKEGFDSACIAESELNEADRRFNWFKERWISNNGEKLWIPSLYVFVFDFEKVEKSC